MAVKLHPTTTTISSAIDDAYSILSDLRDELQEANDNTPDSLQGGDAYSAREEAISALGEFCDDSVELHENYVDTSVKYASNRRKSQSRSDRRDEAVRMLNESVESIERVIEKIENDLEEGAIVEEAEEFHREVVTSLRDTIEKLTTDAETADAVEFPGRNG